MRALVLPILLAACAIAAPPVATPPALAPTDRIAAECRLLEAAQAETRARGLIVWPDVLAGCPGHSVTTTMTLPQMSDATRRANAAPLPPAARALSPRADLIFRRMITRGVPVVVAETLTATPVFAASIR